MSNTTVAQKLRGWRESRGFSQREAAQTAGMSQAAWCGYEAGHGEPRAEAIQKLLAVTAGSDFALSFEDFVRPRRGRRVA